MNGFDLIKIITNAHPERVRLLYRKYQIDAPVSAQTLALAILANGEPFISDLATLVSMDSMKLNVEGTTPATTPTTTADKKWYETIFTDISTAMAGITTIVKNGGDLWQTVNSEFGTELSAKEQAAYNMEMYRYQAEQERLASNQKLIIYGVIGVAIFALIAFVVMRKK